MPKLPAPMPFDPAGGDLPVSSGDDVRAVWPASLIRETPAEQAPVREALITAETAMFEAYQDASAYAAAQADPTRATGIYLRGHAEDRGLIQAPGEGDDAFRDRLFTPEATVTPTAILAIADGILAGFTFKKCQLFESATDRLFVSDGTAVWHSFMGTQTDPAYSDRQYGRRPQSSPGGSWLFSDSLGRMFVLRVPVIDAQGTAHSYFFDGTTDETAYATGAYFTDGTNINDEEDAGFVPSYFATTNATALELYQAIASSVIQHKGQGVRFILYADPAL